MRGGTETIRTERWWRGINGHSLMLILPIAQRPITQLSFSLLLSGPSFTLTLPITPKTVAALMSSPALSTHAQCRARWTATKSQPIFALQLITLLNLKHLHCATKTSPRVGPQKGLGRIRLTRNHSTFADSQRCANYAFRSGNLCSKKQSNYAQIMLQILLFYASVMLWIQPNYAS